MAWRSACCRYGDPAVHLLRPDHPSVRGGQRGTGDLRDGPDVLDLVFGLDEVAFLLALAAV